MAKRTRERKRDRPGRDKGRSRDREKRSSSSSSGGGGVWRSRLKKLAKLLLLLALGGLIYLLWPGPGEKLPQKAAKAKAYLESLISGKSIQETLARLTGGEAAKKPPGKPARTHTVEDGESLWTIANQGKLVKHPWEWRDILLQNKDKIDYPFHSQAGGGWKVVLKKGAKLAVRSGGAGPTPAGPAENRYALQLASLPPSQLSLAVETVKSLLESGQYAYLYRTEVNGQVSYRIRTGLYDGREEADQARQDLMARFAGTEVLKGPYYLVAMQGRDSSEKIQYGAQLNKPWVLELPQRDSHAQALEDLARVRTQGDLAYLFQQQDVDSGQFIYTTRVGYYTTYQEAHAALNRIQANHPEAEGAHPVKVSSFSEALPGQTLTFTPPK